MAPTANAVFATLLMNDAYLPGAMVLGHSLKDNTGVYGELLARWWTVYDKHYRARETVYYDGQGQQKPKKVQDYVSGEETMYLPAYQAPPPTNNDYQPSGDAPAGTAEQSFGDQPSIEEKIRGGQFEPTPTVEQRRWSAPHTDWEPAKAPPPIDSKPEASNFPSQIYDFSEDVKLFEPPSHYPDAPKDMWYEVPAKVEPEVKLKPIFPWEERAPKPTRVFAQSSYYSPSQDPISQWGIPSFSPSRGSPQRTPSVSDPAIPTSSGPVLVNTTSTVSDPSPSQPEESVAPTSEPSQPTSTARPDLTFHSMAEIQPKAEVDSTPLPVTDHADSTKPPVEEDKEEPYVSPWESLRERSNVWDDMPEIAQYVQALQPPKRAPVQVLHHTPSVGDRGLGDIGSPPGQTGRRLSVKVTDFPTEYERPSLPVTPAPIRRPTFWGDEKEMSGELPTAEGVPEQEEWNPIAKLEELQQRQSEALIGIDMAQMLKEPPKRDLPESASREAVEAAVDKATSPLSARPLKPILKEPSFEIPEKVGESSTNNATTLIHNAVTEDADVLSPGDTGESIPLTSTSAPQVAA